MFNRFGRLWHVFPLGVVAGALVLSGCSSSGGSGPASGSSPASSVSTSGSGSGDVLGAPKPASGDPVSIGFVYDGVTDAQDLTAELTGATAATKYINAYLGGIAGRPIKLDVCATNQTPAGAATCVTKFATDKVVAAINPDSAVQGAMLPQLATAGIPVFVGASLDQKTLSTPDVFIMENGLGYGLAGPAKLAAQAGDKRAAIVVTDVPAAAGAVKAAAPMFYGNVGVKVDVVPIPPGTADMSPQIQAELSHSPGLMDIIGVPAFCAQAIRAMKSVGFQGTIVVLSPCANASTATTAGDLTGVKVVTSTTTDPNSAEFKLYAAVMSKYSPGKDQSGLTPDGYQANLGFARALAGLTGGVTRQSISAALKRMNATPMPLADGITFKCDGTAVPVIAPNICASAVLSGALGAQGQVDAKGYSVLDVSDVLKVSK
jgi:branched-chain amino acid transport system substrate-binding protein